MSRDPIAPPDGSLLQDDVAFADLGRRSRALIADLQHASGAYPACPTFSAYRGYAWLRDGSFTAEGMSRAGDPKSADRFHDWVARVIESRAEKIRAVTSAHDAGLAIDPADLLPTRFTLDGQDGDDPWWDFQTDGYGTWLWAAMTHAQRHNRTISRWEEAIILCTDYLIATAEMPCYDWWEEHSEQRHISTLAAIYGGLTAVSRYDGLDERRRAQVTDTAQAVRSLALEATAHGSLTKWIGSAEVDASLAAAVTPFGLVGLPDPVAEATLGRIDAELNVDGGVHRFAADVFYGGGQWPLLSCLLGWNKAVMGDREGALELLRWVAATAQDDCTLPEQVPTHLLHKEHRQEWIDRWGPVATPLLWSHGMYLILADELGLLEELT